MCRFPGETESYKAVSRALRRIASQSRGVKQAFERPSTHSSERSFSDIEKACMSLFSVFDIADYKRLLPKPVRGTCQWIMDHPLFRSWLEKAENSLLWLTGHPGCGKTVLSYSLARSFEELKTSHTSRNVLVYFCDDKVNNQKDAKSILISLIFQIVHRHRSLIRHVRKVFDIQGPSIVQSFSSLWNIFLRLLKDPKSGLIYVIIDALDECEAVSCHQLLESIYELVGISDPNTGDGNHIKFLLTSRPSLELAYTDINKVPHHISIDEGQPGYYEDLRIFIQQRVEEIALKRKYSIEVKDFLLQALYAKADQTFLWIHMVLEAVENSLLSSIKDFRDIMTKIPPTLETTYLDFLSAIPSDHQETALRLLKLVLASSRPLYLDEINVAFTIDSSHHSVEDVGRDCQNAMAHTIQGILGPFARVLESKVSLVHQSAKDFLLQKNHYHESSAIFGTINTESAALRMTIACVRYLLLDDFSRDLFGVETSPVDSIFEPSALPSYDFSEASSVDDIDLNTDMFFREPSVHDAETSQSIATKYSFYSYASLHWAEHFALCETSVPSWLSDAAKTLLDVKSSCCRNWLHFYWSEAATSMEEDPMGFDQLTLAAYFNLHEMLTDLLNRQPPQETKDRALFWASRVGHSRIITPLLAAGADPSIRGGSSMQFALTIAAENGHLGCVAALLADKRTDVNIQDRNGRTALSFACSNGLYEIAKALLSRDECKPDLQDNSGATPLFWAAGGGHMTIVEALARRPDVEINHRDNTGRTIVSWTAGDGMDEVLKRLLQLRNINVDVPDNKGRSPLSWAAGNGHAATAHMLLVHRRPIKNIAADRDYDGRNPISWACGGGHHDVLRVLLHGPWAGGHDDEDIDGWAPLAWAIHNDAPEVVEAMAATGRVDLDRRDRAGRTALAWAVEYGHTRVVQALLREGADPGPTDVNENEATSPAPVAVAKRYGREDLILAIEIKGQ
ncbi:ankyrin repeat-containing domain protein [Camillea tinctor]|nr:ankyrin repeat-containing domain protein [Camillea tinctor]